MPQSQSAASDRPRLLRVAGASPEEPDRAAKVLLDAFDAADREGRHPASLTVQWDDATLALDLAAWRGYREGSLSLEAVATRLQIQSSADPAAAAKAAEAAVAQAQDPGRPAVRSASVPFSVETLKHPLVLGGCGLLLLLGVLGLVALVVRALARRPARALPPRPSPAPPRVASGRPPAQLRFLSGPLAGRTVPLAARVRIGREAGDNDLVLEDPSVSRHHALIAWEADACQVRDLGSSNGTFLNGMRMDRPLPLSAGDQLTVGQIRIEVL